MKILVTGYGGFLGSEIARQLIERGDHVVGFGRRSYPHMSDLPIQTVCGDIRRASDVRSACKGVDAVIHTAAIAGVWGKYQRYFDINTLGTQHVVEGCREHGVRTLIHCSSPSVTFGGRDQSGVDESEPYPERYWCAYPKTKAMAEQHVLAANQPGTLATCSLRPHLIWAADDPHLFPRLVQRARSGRLIRVGSGENLIDTIHVRNAAHAHLLALDRLSGGDLAPAGRAFFLSQDEPVACWSWLCEILRAAGIDPPRRSISYRAAFNIGRAFEWLYTATRRQSEPPMTRFLAAQLAKDHYFDISAAKQLLGYKPIISSEEGLAELKEQWTSK
ncbi:MAG: NAD-dependent epimerase/dehydratase family protein [Pirellulaceae bacterium]